MTTPPEPRSAPGKARGRKAKQSENNADASVGPKDNAPVGLKVLIDRVTQSSGAKRKDVKIVVEAALVQLGEALTRGEAMNLPGLGNLRVTRPASADAPAMTLKLRRGGPRKTKPAASDEAAGDAE